MHLASAEEVDVEVVDRLSALGAGADDDSIAFAEALFARDCGSGEQEAAEQWLAKDARCFFGITRMWVGAFGSMSWKARTASSSKTFFEGMLPATILQKMQSESRFHLSVVRPVVDVDQKRMYKPAMGSDVRR